jgi:outer membrane immunogenic protein
LGVCGATAAANADGYQRARVAAPCCAFSWTGVYVGANGGYGWGPSDVVHIDETFNGAPFFNGNFGSLALSGGFGGFQVGGNFQMGAVVLGLESDFQWGDISDEFGRHHITLSCCE